MSSIHHSAQKHFWNYELDELKQKSIMWHDVLTNSGRPGSGIIHQIKCSCKLKYKSAIRKAFRDDENEHNDEPYEHFLNKQIPECLKCWSSKFHKNIFKKVYINGSNKDIDVANTFVAQFR